jgi:hypothetical protein
MIQDRLSIELQKVAARFQRLWGWQMYAAAWLSASLLVLAARWLQISFVVSSIPYANAIILGTGVVLVYSILHWRFLTSDQHWVARQIEDHYPSLDNCLLTAVEQAPELPDGRYGFLQESVIRQALRHAAANDWLQVVSRGRILLAITASLATFCLFVWSVSRMPDANSALAATSTKSPRNAPGTGEFSVTVEPGDTEVERGNSLLVLARVQGPLPADATLISQPASGEPSRQDMSPSLDDPLFGGRVTAVTEPFEYRVELGGHVSPTYHVTVFEYPRLERADARLKYPSYTGLEERLIQDVRTVSVVEGTEVSLICQLNKAVKSARFVEAEASKRSEKVVSDSAAIDKTDESVKPAAEIPAAITLTAREGNCYDVQFTAEKTRRLKLELIDAEGRKNPDPILIVVQVVPNQPPTLKMVAPGRDLEVSPLEELDVKATAWDDYGVKRMGMSFGLAGQTTTDLVLGENAAARQKHELANLIHFEDLHAEPDQLLAYHFWAEDFGSDGKLRRTSSDMYFAEVRHFDEIFRQGQQPPGGEQQQRQQRQQSGSQNAQAAQQLAELQKDIINATWKLVRREVGAKPTESFAEDVDQISQSQSAAVEQAEALGAKITDPEAQGHLLAVMEAMELAVKQLTAAHAQPAVAPLQPALAAEQKAYQALLKLRAREHEVVRQQQQQQQQQQQASSQGARSQQQRQQMQQLDLKDEENRYETQRLAQAQQEQPEDRETKQVLNRLKELARRQHDLNERLKDLQSALQEAQTEQKKEEVRQQLKRLQDEQKDVLRDTDELQSRMDAPENQERMAEQAQQLEQARDQVRRSSESLEQNKVTQAAASGTRAEKEFDELKNEFRRRSSQRFNEEVREMRDAARALDQEEKKIAEKLAGDAQPDTQKKSLRDDNRAEEITKGLAEQKERLSTLTERVKQTVTEAEQTEPLLSERLHDAARTLQDQKVEPALDATNRSVRQGLMDDAREVERIAGKGIKQFREGMEKAAEAVLGDETEALRRAREQLKNLAQELNQEIARNAPEEQPQGQLPRGQNENGQNENSQNQNGQNPSGQPQNNPGDQSRPGQRPDGQQPGEQQAGNRPPGQDPAGQTEAEQREPGKSQPGQPGQPGQPQNRTGQRPGQNAQQPGQQQPGEQQPGQGQQPGQQPGQQRPGAGPRTPGQPGAGQPGEGQPPGNQPAGAGQPPAEGENEEPRPEGQAGQRPMPQGQQRGAGAGQRPGQGQAAGQGQPQEGTQPQPGQQGQPGQNPQQGQTGGQQRGGQQRGQRGGARGTPGAGNPNGGGIIDGNAEPTAAPISGTDFMNWSDRLRDVEEMVDNPELRAEAARIREQARSIRAEMKRHSSTPNWKLVRVNVAEPLIELSNRVSDELLRRNSKQAIVPLDRDPVPPKYSEKTRRYYEQLGNGK